MYCPQTRSNRQWLRDRHAAVRQIVGARAASGRADIIRRAESGAIWTDENAKEDKKLKEKYDCHMAVALEDNMLLAKESTAEVRRNLSDLQSRRLKRDKDHLRDEKMDLPRENGWVGTVASTSLGSGCILTMASTLMVKLFAAFAS